MQQLEVMVMASKCELVRDIPTTIKEVKTIKQGAHK